MKALAVLLGALALVGAGACESRKQPDAEPSFAHLPAPDGCVVKVPSLEAMLPPSGAASQGTAKDGQPGLLLGALPTDHPLGVVGLRAGDVWVKANGLPLSSPVAALTALKTIQQRGAVTAVYERDGASGTTTCSVQIGP